MDFALVQLLVTAVVTVVGMVTGWLSLEAKRRGADHEARISALEKEVAECQKERESAEAYLNLEWPTDIPSEEPLHVTLTKARQAFKATGQPFTVKTLVDIVRKLRRL